MRVALEQGFSNLEKVLYLVGGGIMMAMMLLVTTDIAGRYLLNSPVQGTLELTQFFMVGMLYLSLGYIQYHKANIRIDLLLVRLSPRTQLILAIIVYLLGLVFFALILWQGVRMSVDALVGGERTIGSIRFPTYPARFAVPLGSLVLCVQLLIDIAKSVSKVLQRSST